MSAPLVGRVLADRLEDAGARQRDGLRAVMVVLADHADSRGLCWPGVERIAELALRSPRQVQRLLGDLERLGRITAVGGRQGGRTRATCWRVTPHAPVVTLPPAERATRTAVKGDTWASPEPTTEPSPLPPRSGGDHERLSAPPASPSLPGLERGGEHLPHLGGRRAAGTSLRDRGESPRQLRQAEGRQAQLEEDRRRRALEAEEAARRASPEYQAELRAARLAALAQIPHLAPRHAAR